MTADEIEAKATRIRRAREVFDGADWLFREYAEGLQAEWLNTDPEASEKRETIYRRLRAVIEVKAILVSILNEADNDEVLRGHTR